MRVPAKLAIDKSDLQAAILVELRKHAESQIPVALKAITDAVLKVLNKDTA